MGALQMKGLVSGFGKGLQRGLENTQQYMINSMLLEEREKMERERQKLTFAHDEGMFQKRADAERGLMTDRAALENKYASERDERTHSQAMDRLDAEQDFRSQEARSGRSHERQMATEKRQQQLEDAFRERGWTEADAKQKAAEQIAKEEREQRAKIDEEGRQEKALMRKEKRDDTRDEKKFQRETGKDIVLESMRGQRQHTGTDKLDPNTNAQLRILTDRIKGLEDELNNVMTKPDRQQAIRKEISKLQAQQNALVGMQSPSASRPPIRFPQ